MAQTKVSIDNIEVGWANVSISAPGLGDTGAFLSCTAIKWQSGWDVQTIYGLGGEPRGQGIGNHQLSASITLNASSQQMLWNLGNGSLMGIGRFDLTVSFTQMFNKDDQFNSVTLKGCLITQSGLDVKQGDTSIPMEYDLHPLRIVNTKSLAMGGGIDSGGEMCISGYASSTGGTGTTGGTGS